MLNFWGFVFDGENTIFRKLKAVLLLFCTIFIIIGVATEANVESRKEAESKTEEHISLWNRNGDNIRLEGTYIYATETFCFTLRGCSSIRTASVRLQSRTDRNIVAILVNDFWRESSRIDKWNNLQYRNCIRLNPIMFNMVKNELIITIWR